MKRTKKNTTESSVKEKVKAIAKAKKTKAPLPTSLPPVEDTGKSTTTTPTPSEVTSVKGPETKALDGSIRIDHLPFETQAAMIFNPLVGLQQRVVGSDTKVANVASASTAVITSK